MQWSEVTARVWVPHTGAEIASAPPRHSLPFPLTQPHDPDGEPEGLVVVVGSRTQLVAAEDAAASGRAVVIWAWRCPEYIAQEAEDSFPVVYGRISQADVTAAAQKGAGRSDLTTLCMAAEMALEVPDVLE